MAIWFTQNANKIPHHWVSHVWNSVGYSNAVILVGPTNPKNGGVRGYIPGVNLSTQAPGEKMHNRPQGRLVEFPLEPGNFRVATENRVIGSLSDPNKSELVSRIQCGENSSLRSARLQAKNGGDESPDNNSDNQNEKKVTWLCSHRHRSTYRQRFLYCNRRIYADRQPGAS